ncbi:MAG: hypothetical protein QXX19_06570 [Candidatus Caldarchaeum sp.]
MVTHTSPKFGEVPDTVRSTVSSLFFVTIAFVDAFAVPAEVNAEVVASVLAPLFSAAVRDGEVPDTVPALTCSSDTMTSVGTVRETTPVFDAVIDPR